MINDTCLAAYVAPSDFVSVSPNLPGATCIAIGARVAIYTSDEQAKAMRDGLLRLFPLQPADPTDLISDAQAKADLALQTV